MQRAQRDRPQSTLQSVTGGSSRVFPQEKLLVPRHSSCLENAPRCAARPNSPTCDPPPRTLRRSHSTTQAHRPTPHHPTPRTPGQPRPPPGSGAHLPSMGKNLRASPFGKRDGSTGQPRKKKLATKPNRQVKGGGRERSTGSSLSKPRAKLATALLQKRGADGRG